ncbi:MAG: PilZ domain-containing protein [Gammaproteobacteria bacterium]|nr:PilZ domain-containing protein [Gammaproteobacteria bacterium]
MKKNTAQTKADQRQSARHGVQIDGREHLFTMSAGQQDFPITAIRDVSVSGAGLEMDQPLKQGTAVVLHYTEGDFKLDIDGTVMWCTSTAARSKFALGIEFSRSNGSSNSFFFLAMRKFLDEFDGVTTEA